MDILEKDLKNRVTGNCSSRSRVNGGPPVSNVSILAKDKDVYYTFKYKLQGKSFWIKVISKINFNKLPKLYKKSAYLFT